MRKSSILLVIICFSSALSAQTRSEFIATQRDNYFAEKQKNETDYKRYRDELNAQYVQRLKETWDEFTSSPATPQPIEPEPPGPIIASPNEKPICEELPTKELTQIPQVKPEPPKPLLPSPTSNPSTITDQSYNFSYYGTPCSIPLDETHQLRLSSVDEKGVSEAWMLLSSDNYNKILAGCLWWKESLCLGDWGYVRFVEKLSNSYFGEKYENESIVMQLYLLVQSGYKARIAKRSNSLYLLLPCQSEIYEYPYISFADQNYYIINAKNSIEGSYSMFTDEFAGEQTMSLFNSSEPNLNFQYSNKRRLESKRYPEACIDVRVNKNLIDFYGDFPRSSSWDFYSYASISADVRSTLYPFLKQIISSKTELEQVEILLNFTQTAFEYKTDGDQFGYERPLFADETLFYPFSDCEDRAILFSILVRELVGLDVVLVHYPGHLATAVSFSSTIKGDYINVNGRQFTICDPTYIGAQVGLSMPDYRETKASIIKL